MRILTSHRHNTCNKNISVTAEDEPGQGGASHLYMLRGFNTKTNPSCPFTTRHGQPAEHATILFQNGPIAEDGNGVNGVTNEALLAVVLDRLNGFQTGEYRCRENALAITKIEEAMHWMLHRTREREMRGVEGTHGV